MSSLIHDPAHQHGAAVVGSLVEKQGVFSAVFNDGFYIPGMTPLLQLF